MTLICYHEKRFTASSWELIHKANEIIEEYQAEGFTLTLRQLYYQFVARDILPNRQNEYKRLGSIINDAKMAGQVPWEAVEEREKEGRKSISDFAAELRDRED